MKPVTYVQEKEKLFQNMVIQPFNVLPLYFQISRRPIVPKCIRVLQEIEATRDR